MTEEQLGKILQEYAQADISTAANYGGTGLGLTITTSLIQMMGGYLDVESEYGTGTTFTINVPRYIEEAANETAYSDIVGDSGPLVLIVDDDTSTQDLIRRMLKTQNFRMAGASERQLRIGTGKILKPDVIFWISTCPTRMAGKCSSSSNQTRNLPTHLFSSSRYRSREGSRLVRRSKIPAQAYRPRNLP